MLSCEVFQVFFVYLVCNSLLFFASCCCSFLLHVAANLICIFLVCVNWFYFQLFQKIFSTLVVQMCVPSCSSENFNLNWCQSFLSFCLLIQISLLYRRMGWTSAVEYRGGIWGVQTPPPHQILSSDKPAPNSLFRGKYILNNLTRIWVSLICKLSGTPD
jgi:hypothetical protein